MFVAYVSEKYGEQQKLMVQASNGSTLELARGTLIRSPRWSPDGSEVLFFRYEPELFRVERSAKSWGFSAVSRLGGVAHPIAFAAYACWLKPNGAEIVTATRTEGSGFKGVTLVNKLTGETQDVTLSGYEMLHDIDCSVRTGLILAVMRNSEKFQIRVFRRDGSDQRSVIEESDQIFSARWSPAGDSIYYLHGKGSTTELSRISIKDKHAEPVAIANGLQTGEFFTLSADGSRLAYTREYHHSDLWQLRWQSAGTKPEIKRLTSGTFHYGAPSFSPDGRWMSFVLGANEDETNVYKMPSAGGEPELGEFRVDFEGGKPVKPTASTGFMERAMGIEPTSEAGTNSTKWSMAQDACTKSHPLGQAEKAGKPFADSIICRWLRSTPLIRAGRMAAGSHALDQVNR
jgi:hypothetical protein